MTVVILHSEPRRLSYLCQEMPELEVEKKLDLGAYPKLLIRWGVNEGPDPDCAVVINRAKALQLLPEARKVWQKNNINLHSRSCYRRYSIYMFDLLPVLILRQEIGSRATVVVGVNSSKETREATALAARALHVLGLDFAAVDIRLCSQGRLGVAAVNVAPRDSRLLAQALVEPIRRRLREVELRQTMSIFQRANPAYLDKAVSIGADPEFMLRDNRTGKMLMASTFFPREGTVGCDSRFVKGTVSGYPLAELRPAPSYSPLQLTDNIRRAMELALRLSPYGNIEWRGGSMPFRKFPIGGHIHFAGVLVSGQLLRAFDNYLAIPLLLIEEGHTAALRRAKYGYLGDFRMKVHGGFEYRTPSSWLISPEIATATLCLAKVIASEYHVLRHDVFACPEAQVAFAAADRAYFTSHFRELWADIRTTSTFALYARVLEVLEEMILAGRTWSEKADIRRAWGLRIPRSRIYR
ncbi:MAG: hypothetical protein KGZ50_05965 [Peptococcaceae bacterium]|nr:hypothetical protein [Peptococcaceae bacterium]